MTSREHLARIGAYILRPSVLIIGALIVAGIGMLTAMWLTSTPQSGAYVAVSTGSITEEVDVSGIVKAKNDAKLSFQTGGEVSYINVAVGDHVTSGQLLMSLNNNTQASAVAIAKANLKMQKARLSSLLAGTRFEQIAINETSVARSYDALINAINTSFISADDAVHAKSDSSFSNPRVSSAKLIPLVPDILLVNRVQRERVLVEGILKEMHSYAFSATSQKVTDITSVSSKTQADLNTISAFLGDLSNALFKAVANGSISGDVIAKYRTSVDMARIEVASAERTLVNASASYKSAVNTLTLARAGATKNTIDAQMAFVDSARASLDMAISTEQKARLRAPFSGTISVQDATRGETVSPGIPLVSIISDGENQITSMVSEMNIEKIHVGDNVIVTFSAYPNKIFNAHVTTVSPSATEDRGSISYTITATFDSKDPRIKPGLSANLRIITKIKENTLIVPTSSIITDGKYKFVYVKKSGSLVKKYVITGIKSAFGMTEITSGVSVGDNVLTFGNGSGVISNL